MKVALNSHQFICANIKECGKKETKPLSFSRCSKCHWTRYCSSKCQLSHWKSSHKLICNKSVTAEVAESIIKGRRIIIGSETELEKQ